MLSPPPVPLPRPNACRLASGHRLHRVHLAEFTGTAFNPCRGAPTRFAPILDRNGACVPSLYAGSTVEAAIFETLFHDIPPTDRRKTYPRSLLAKRCHSVIVLRRDLTLAELRAPDLRLWHVARTDLVASSPSQYGETARWAEALHHAHPDFDGMIWTSNQCDPADAVVLFGDRIEKADLVLVGTQAGTERAFESEVQRAAMRAGITLTL
ncbi:RES family NAD+ phosphorylase [Acuticoccus sp. MNP-M23]|uniref:RES family NAD+ phosphorylase n=1 Tax=Acuticoccus sp. MNP-M23 TaxID=3072793 RepID=UPI002816217C|nr:RES family NAD+ phosphorylase [Acuticoccus sp. MNP-M23]WMS43921.1 RES family NAD+ phosphorylase [Acuticoccus sp. MNP-M23]